MLPKGGQNRAKFGEKVDPKSKLDQHGVQEVPKRAPRVDFGSTLVPKLLIFGSFFKVVFDRNVFQFEHWLMYLGLKK